jgi:hypothetical protein
VPPIPEGEITISTLILAVAIVSVKAFGEFVARRWPRQSDVSPDFKAFGAQLDELKRGQEELLAASRKAEIDSTRIDALRNEHYQTTKHISEGIEKLRRNS